MILLINYGLLCSLKIVLDFIYIKFNRQLCFDILLLYNNLLIKTMFGCFFWCTLQTNYNEPYYYYLPLSQIYRYLIDLTKTTHEQLALFQKCIRPQFAREKALGGLLSPNTLNQKDVTFCVDNTILQYQVYKAW